MRRREPEVMNPHFIVVSERDRDRPVVVATLGPAGTSSERAAARVLDLLDATDGRIALHDTYHDAAQAVLDGAATFLVVANAFHEINLYYMNPRLKVSAVLHMHTPLYGLAARDVAALPRTVEVVSHPAPVPLVQELLPEDYSCSRVVLSNSTSSAAEAVSRGEYPVALTTEPAAQANGLTFISRLRPIEMVWTAFTLDEEDDDAASLN